MLLLAGSSFLGLILCELILWRFFPFFDPYAGLRRVEHKAYIPGRHAPNFEYRARYEKDLPGLSGEMRFTTNRWGFRGDDLSLEKVDGEKRVFLIGGSTMECGLIDDAAAPSALIQHLLSAKTSGTVKVENAAHSGDVSYDHVAMLAHRIAHFHPDVVVVMAGLNDLRASIEGRDYLHLNALEMIDYNPSMLAKLGLTELQLPRRVWGLFKPPQQSAAGQNMLQGRIVDTTYRLAADRCAASTLSKLPATSPQYFEDNLRTLAGIARAHGAELVIVTQATNWGAVNKSWHWMSCVWPRRFDEVELAAALEHFNARSRLVAAEMSLPLVEAPLATEYFYDDAHFNTLGASRLASAIAEAINFRASPGR